MEREQFEQFAKKLAGLQERHPAWIILTAAKETALAEVTREGATVTFRWGNETNGHEIVCTEQGENQVCWTWWIRGQKISPHSSSAYGMTGLLQLVREMHDESLKKVPSE